MNGLLNVEAISALWSSVAIFLLRRGKVGRGQISIFRISKADVFSHLFLVFQEAFVYPKYHFSDRTCVRN
jgi:hypothetical protein